MIKLEQLSFNYPQMPMLFDLHIPKGEKVAIIGASGAGKSTLLHLIAGFEFASQGKIYLNHQDHTHTQPHQRPVSMLFQENNIFNHLTVEQNVTLGLHPSLKLNSQQKEKVEMCLNNVGLIDFKKRLPEQLSGGQRQRIAIARCLLRDKPILLLDEPFSALDGALRIEMLALLTEITEKQQLTLVMVTHQPDEVAHFVTRTLTIKDGHFV